MSRRPLALTLIVAALAVAGCGSSSKTSSTTASTPAKTASTSTSAKTASTGTSAATGTSTSATGSGAAQESFENVPIEQGSQIGSASTTGTGTVDGIQCAPTEQLAYHIHVHLQVYDNGQPRALPGGIGIPGSRVETVPQYGPVAVGGKCYYWLHTHAPDGVIHIESPTQKIYTLGEFFDEWHQPLTSTEIGSVKGTQTWTVNGKPWRKNPRDIPLNAHATIQVSVGQPIVPFRQVNWAQTQL